MNWGVLFFFSFLFLAPFTFGLIFCLIGFILSNPGSLYLSCSLLLSFYSFRFFVSILENLEEKKTGLGRAGRGDRIDRLGGGFLLFRFLSFKKIWVSFCFC